MAERFWTDEELAAERRRNNPTGEPTGHYTGRCERCGSRDLWDDGAWYGCNNCDAMYSTAHIAPRRIENGTGRDLGPAWEEQG